LSPIRVFIGYDPRQPVAFNVLQHSIHKHASQRVIVEPLMLHKLPITRRCLTEFTYSRYLVPWLCGYEGSAVFMDADIVVTGDISELLAQADEGSGSAVQVNTAQPKFEWASVMLFNNWRCEVLTPEWIDDLTNKPQALNWGPVGSFSPEWNHCVGYTEPAAAKLYHYTQGIPCWYETRGLPEDEHWLNALKDMQYTVGWKDLMGTSVHAKPTMERLFKRLTSTPN
jgi:hypothetical protein